MRLIVPGMEFEDYLELACGEIRRKGCAEPVVLRSLVRILRMVGDLAHDERIEAIRDQLELIRSSAKRSIPEQHDLDLVLHDLDEAILSLQPVEPRVGMSTTRTPARN